MHPPRIGLLRPVRKLAPRSLLARSLLMILLPLVILQAIALQIFYGSHLELVSRRFGAAVAGEIGDTIALLHRFPDPDAQTFILRQAYHQYEIDMRIEPGAVLPDTRSRNIIGPMDDDLADAMRAKVGLPFKMDWISDPQAVLLRVQLPHGVLDVHAPRKRLYTSTIYLFLLWLMGSSLLLFGIAAVFMRNQVRAIRRLAAAAEAFGLGREHPPIKPEGAAEVRRAATAFNRMQERLRRFLTQRTEMLAGVSHDLRTPLTRLRLALAMLPPDERYAQDIGEMTTDVEEMERMIGGYLAFARGEGSEQAQATDLAVMLEELAASARRSGARVELAASEGLVLKLRPDAMRRAIANLLDNARRHARRITLAAALQGERTVLVTVDDDGPGIPAERRESVFRPFESGAAGGTGLGLTIARDIVRAHGGEILLEDSPLGGLRARVRLPV
jgi:two-component system osmolarity sensor histidine kinase EnvZ